MKKFRNIGITCGAYGGAALLSGVTTRTIETIKNEGLTVGRAFKIIAFGSVLMLLSITAVATSFVGIVEIFDAFEKQDNEEKEEQTNELS